ncbi:hypothetical protein [Laspinema olomoucense]|uniref:hypothetical protein n=1 Tax=Laspinema olomoucense TaxID=3231600 RepID=UPI0021BB9C2C|nr:hypothetical protein [Laspinema sp. D3c]MCT7995536.1 hypothetical protein [Laspinema sp. D3c]
MKLLPDRKTDFEGRRTADAAVWIWGGDGSPLPGISGVAEGNLKRDRHRVGEECSRPKYLAIFRRNRYSRIRKHRFRPFLPIDLDQSCAALLVLFSIRDRGVHVSQDNRLCTIVLSTIPIVNLYRCECSRHSTYTLNSNASSDEKIRIRKEFHKAVIPEN